MANAHSLDPTILREYDIRGIVGDTLNPADVEAIGRSFGSIVSEKYGSGKSVCVGYDGRLSSTDLEAALIKGLASTGVDVVRIGLGPTPMLYYATQDIGADGGMMITGSHNPPDYNGIKMVLGGHSFFGDEIQDLGRRCTDGRFAEGEGRVRKIDIQDQYVERMLADFTPAKNLCVAWDPGNGASGDVITRLTKLMPGRHILINEDIDGNFPNHHPDPTVEANLDQLKAVVAENNCDLGIGFDGDGDRIGVIDGAGRMLYGDQTLLILAREILARHPGAPIITEVKASQMFFDEISAIGGNPIMWKTGHSLIKAKMAELDAPLAGEMSGHIFFADGYYGFDDAIYAAIRLLNILETGEESLAQIRDNLPQMLNTPELRFECSEERKFEVIEEVKARLADGAAGTVHDIDGVRVENDDGWWLLRASNTQAVLVARCEAKEPDALDRLKTTLVAQLSASGIAPPDFG